MKEIYLVRHAQSDASYTDTEARPLTEKGLSDRAYIVDYFKGKPISEIYASPYRRAVETLIPLADERGQHINKNPDFREWMGGRPFPPEQFDERMLAMWNDFSHQAHGCESFLALSRRVVRGICQILDKKDISYAVIGGHGLMMSVCIRHFYPLFGYDQFQKMLKIAPWIAKMYFDGRECAGMQFIDPAKTDENAGNLLGIRMYETGALKAYRFVVIFARHQEKWVYCRAKTRNGFETAGGHIEEGETPDMAARRELFEETGAVDFDIQPLFDYAVDREMEYANGRVYLANVRSFGAMPDFEMQEICLMDGIPEVMRFPEILPVLKSRVSEITGIL